MKFKSCFVNGHCCCDCPNFQLDMFEEKYDLPASEIGLEKTTCKSATSIPENVKIVISMIPLIVQKGKKHDDI